MKKFLVSLYTLGFLLGLIGTASAILFKGTAVFLSEPASMLLFGLGLIGLARFGRKKGFKNIVRHRTFESAIRLVAQRYV